MPIMFNTILLEAGLPLGGVRLLRHKDKRAARGLTPYELWRDNRQQFDSYQSTQSLGSQGKLAAPYWASFVVTPSGETMFVGAYRVKNRRLLEQDTPMPHMDGVDKAGTCYYYDLELDQALGDLIGKLIVDWGLGDRAWIRNPSDYQVSILEVAGTSLTEHDILKKEGQWKSKLQSQEMGLNRN